MSSAPRKKKTFLVVLGSLGLLLACAAVGFYFYTIWAADKELQDAIAEADRLDPGWRLEELEANRPTLPDGQNSAVQILAVASMIPAGWPPIPPPEEQDKPWWVLTILEISPELELSQEQIKKLGTELQKVSPALTAARKLANLPQGRYTVSWSLDPSSTILPCQQARDVANLLELDAFFRAQNKDPEGALESIRCLLNDARSVGDEPSAISQLVRMACEGVTITSLERILAQGQVSAHRLAGFQDSLQNEMSEPLLLYALRGERAQHHRMMEAIKTGQLKMSSITASLSSRPPPAGLKGWWEDVSAEMAYREMHAPWLRTFTEVVDVAKLPAESQRLKLEPLLASIDKDSRLPLLARATVMTTTGRIPDRFWRQQAHLRCAVVAVAAERYRLAHNRWPESLEQLVPEFLHEVPLDPYDAKPLRYRRIQEGVVIYSIGPDERDDGGKLDRQNPTAAGTDLGFQLWDVNRRRQPWRPPPKPSDDDDN
jgi:hypothetical protein